MKLDELAGYHDDRDDGLAFSTVGHGLPPDFRAAWQGSPARHLTKKSRVD
jgi:hypothetical protein